MAFDPVRDAILNSPERTSYIDPFDGPELGDQVAGTTTSKGSSFKAPERISTSRNGGSSSPDRLFSHGYATVETPGGLTVPPTPGTSTSEDGRPNTAGGQRTSSIFSLLSPEPPADDSEELQSSNHNGYFDSFQRADSPQAYDQPLPTTSKQMYHEPDLARQKPSSSQFDSREGLKASLTVELTNGDRSGSSRPTSSSSSGGPRHQQRPSGRPAVKEPVKRGRPYAPYRRQGPPPPSLHIPITPEELAFYRNPANCKNPLREGVQVSGRSSPPIRESLRNDMKGKARAPTAPPEDVDIAPQYIEPSPLPPALQPGPVARGRPSLARNSSGSASPKKRKRDSFAASAVTGEGSQVAAFYNKRLNFSREQRNFSPIIGLKSFNNWVKSVLIAKYARDYHSAPEELQQGLNEHGRRGGARRQKPFRVLDIGCGKGGDLQKWQKAGITDYVAIDIAEVSIQQARRRWEELRGRRFDAKFYALDAYSNPLTAIIPESILTEPPFDVVTMQFCMHYAFQSVSKARMMLENVSRYLKPGGTFIGTIPDSEQLLTRLKELPDDAPLAFGNEVYRIAFDDRSKFPAFGHRYTFYLTDAVEDVPEYVVQWGAFETLAAEYNLKLLYHATFHELFSAERETPEFEQLLVRMKVVTPEGESELTEDQWEAANIYVAFAFVKI